MTSKVPEHVRAAAIEAVQRAKTSGGRSGVSVEGVADAALSAVEAALDVYCEASNPAWTRPVQLYRFKGCDEK